MYSIDHCLIVGAGISGLLLAKQLKAHGIDVTILEAGDVPGGRLCTKQIGDATFDHAAQFITTRERAFREAVESWMAAGAAKPWYKGPLGNMRYVGVGGMGTLPVYLAKDLDVRLSERVRKLRFDKGRWKVSTQTATGKASHEADFLVLTPPVPQSVALIRDSNVELDIDDEEELDRITYTRCITILAQLNGPAGLPQPGAMDLNLGALRWLGDNSAKQISRVPGSLTISSSPSFADTYWDHPDEELIPLMLKAAKPFMKSDVISATAHRWSHSEPKRIYFEKQPFRRDFLIDGQLRLGICGDGFAGGRVEAAALSGMHLAEEMTRAV